MQALVKLIDFAIESENIDLLISLMTGTENIPSPIMRRVTHFTKQYTDRHDIPVSCATFECFVQDYRKWLMFRAYMNGDFVQFVAESDPHDIEDIVGFVYNEQQIYGIDFFGAVFYWLVLHNESLLKSEKVDLNVFLLGFELSERGSEEFIEGFVEEAIRNHNYEPIDILRREYFSGTDDERAMFKALNKQDPRDYLDYLVNKNEQEGIELFLNIESYLYPEDLIYLALSLVDYASQDKALLAKYLTEHLKLEEIKQIDTDTLSGVKIDPAFWNHVIFHAAQKGLDLNLLSDLLSLRAYDRDFDPCQVEKERVLTILDNL